MMHRLLSFWQFRSAIARLVLLVAAGTSAAGCVAFPTPGRIERERTDRPNINIRKIASSADSGGPVRPGVSRAVVRNVLGVPDEAWDDGRNERYFYRSYNWWVFCIVPLGHFWGEMSPTEYVYQFDLAFDDKGNVRSLSLARRRG